LKKLVAIVLLSIHLFNIGGQLAFHQFLVYRSDKFFNDQISKNHYKLDDLSEIKVPVNMPGITDWTSFQNLSGRVQFKDASYNYVKIKITRHAIYLICVPNYETTHLSDQNIISARQIADIPVSRKDHVPFGKVNLTVYHCQIAYYQFSAPLIITTKNIDNSYCIIPNTFITGPGQPPDSSANIS
jgi:hypothetical protein